MTMAHNPAQCHRHAHPAPAVLGHCVGLFARYAGTPRVQYPASPFEIVNSRCPLSQPSQNLATKKLCTKLVL